MLAQIDPSETDRLLFTLLTGMREAAIAGVYVRGALLSPPDDAG